MKEFVEKLIDRLKLKIISPYFAINAEYVTFRNVVKIANKLVEEYNNGWIPCSERLPEGNDDVMVMYTDNDGEVDICCLDWFLAYSDTMLAWMPLPEPYKPQESEWKDKVMKHFTNVE